MLRIFKCAGYRLESIQKLKVMEKRINELEKAFTVKDKEMAQQKEMFAQEKVKNAELLQLNSNLKQENKSLNQQIIILKEKFGGLDTFSSLITRADDPTTTLPTTHGPMDAQSALEVGKKRRGESSANERETSSSSLVDSAFEGSSQTSQTSTISGLKRSKANKFVQA